MLLLALLMVADLSLFTADPATVEEYAKKLDEGVPWVDEFGQPAAGEWEGKVKREEDLDLVPAALDLDVQRPQWAIDVNGRFARNGEPAVYLGLWGGHILPHTPVDGRRFLFDDLPERNSPAIAINPQKLPEDLGTVYVSHHMLNLLRTEATVWSDQRVARVESDLTNAGFNGFGPLKPRGSSLPGFGFLDRVKLDEVEDAHRGSIWDEVDPLATAVVVDAGVFPTSADTAELLGGQDSATKRGILMLAERDADLLGRLMQETKPRRPIDLFFKPMRVPPTDLEALNQMHRNVITVELLLSASERYQERLPVFFSPGGEFGSRIVHGETIPDDLAGPIIQVVTLPMEAPGFAGMSEDEAVKRWRTAVRKARADDRVVAVLWGRFWDDPVTGIGPKTDDVRLVQGRAEAAGLWDVTGRPKMSLLKRLNAESDPTDPRDDDERE